MDPETPDGIQTVRELFKARDVKFQQTADGLRVRMETGPHIDIRWPEDPATPVWSARLPLDDPDSRQRAGMASAARQFLEKELAGVVRGVGEFRNILSSASEAGFIYESRIEIDPEVVFFETVLIGDKAADPVSEASVSGGSDIAESPPEITVLTGRADDIQAAEAAFAELETIDSKMLRRSLDMMNLRRSSKVRSALTRIFRDAVDVFRMQSAIREEAEKIISEKDRAELDLIRYVSTDFLKPLISNSR